MAGRAAEAGAQKQEHQPDCAVPGCSRLHPAQMTLNGERVFPRPPSRRAPGEVADGPEQVGWLNQIQSVEHRRAHAIHVVDQLLIPESQGAMPLRLKEGCAFRIAVFPYKMRTAIHFIDVQVAVRRRA